MVAGGVAHGITAGAVGTRFLAILVPPRTPRTGYTLTAEPDPQELTAMTLIAVNPADGTELARYQNTEPEQVEAAIDRAQSAFLAWRARPIAERAELLRSLAATLRAEQRRAGAPGDARRWARSSARPRPRSRSRPLFCEYYADNAERFLAPQTIEGAAASRTTSASSRSASCSR